MRYRIEFEPVARRDVEKLPRTIRSRVETAIDRLADDPRPHGAKKLKGLALEWRIRVGEYRVIYEIHDHRLLVLVVRAAHRREAY